MNLLVSNHHKLEYDNILTIICHIIKYTLFLSIRADLITVNLVQLFFKHVECYFGIPRDIMINKDSCIISNFWHEIYEIKIIKRQILTAHHSQIDDQSETLN